jgi:hypothetical protein
MSTDQSSRRVRLQLRFGEREIEAPVRGDGWGWQCVAVGSLHSAAEGGSGFGGRRCGAVGHGERTSVATPRGDGPSRTVDAKILSLEA